MQIEGVAENYSLMKSLSVLGRGKQRIERQRAPKQCAKEKSPQMGLPLAN